MNKESREFYINMRDSDIPKWNNLYSYDEQDDDVKQFWQNEAYKLTNGVNINGVFIHPWLYWHLNFWHIMLDEDGERIPGLSQLRDNEWLFTEILQQAEKENKGIFLFGTRRFGKALLNSEILYMEHGEKTIGDAMVGDMIYDDSGKLTRISSVHPQGKILTYRMVFEDGRNVICCGNHLWKVSKGGGYCVRKTNSIIHDGCTKFSIPLPKAVSYPEASLPLNASAYGSLTAGCISGSISSIPFSAAISKTFIRSSVSQKRIFIESFIVACCGVVTGNEKIRVVNKNKDILNFIQRMFWSYGWYAKFDGEYLILSSFVSSLKIVDISIYGKHEATCITVENESKMFLTSNFINTHNSAIMSSYLCRNATMTYNLTHTVTGSSQVDLSSLSEYMEFGLDKMHPFLKINRTGNDWFKEVVLGTRSLNNERNVHARIRITNLEGGKSASALKTASGTPYTTIYDEVGKYPFLGAYMNGLPAQMAKGKMRGMIIASGTGGNVEKSQDAQKVMSSPNQYGFIIANYDLLNKRCANPTWRVSKSGCFVPGQMSHSFDKDRTTLDKFLNKTKAQELKEIEIHVTNFEESTESIKNTLNELSVKDRSLFVQHKMAYPLTSDDCFLNANVNRFPVDDALMHKTELMEGNIPGKLVDVYQAENKRMKYHFSDKVLAKFPFSGGNIDCPVVIYEDPPEDGGLFDYTYVSGLDPYKQDKSDTDSLGTFYVLKRYVKINDPFAYKIVASYASRPGVSEDFCRICEILSEGYGAKCLMENADRMFETYLSRKNKEMLILENGEVLANKVIRSGSKQNNKLGLSPTVPNQRMLYNTVLQYCWEDVVVGYNDDGDEITKKGIYRIDDIELLNEIIAFGPGVNTDRIIAFGHALLLAKYYDDMNYMPKSTTEKENEKKRTVRMKKQQRGFVMRRHNPYRMR